MHVSARASKRGLRGATTALAAVLVSAATAAATAAAQSSNAAARVQGAFEMDAKITAAVNVRGERQGEHVRRQWELTPLGCTGKPGPCPALRLVRHRAEGARDTVLLHRTGKGSYAGSGAFYVPLRCKNRIYKQGSRAPYRITLTVAAATRVQGVAFATRLHATYVNLARSDTTPCPLGPSHDAATYSGKAINPTPGPPTPTLVATQIGTTGFVQFADGTASSPGVARVIAFGWDFGDPNSGASDHSSAPTPVHAFTIPGIHTVRLSVLDANGLTASVTGQVTAATPQGVAP